MYNKNIKDKVLPFFILLLFILLNVMIIFNLQEKESKKEDVLRLHVVANSNSLEDQITKLKVNEKVTEYFNNLTKKDNLSKNSILNIAKENSSHIITMADEIIKENNLSYNASLNIGKINYDKKESTTLDMESGNYDSIKIILGDGKGKNIWSLIKPSKENLQKLQGLDSILPEIKNLYNDDIESEDKKDITYDFKIIEILKKII